LAALALRQRFIEECANLFVEAFLRHRITCLAYFGVSRVIGRLSAFHLSRPPLRIFTFS
jgi:hypothetical protein